VLWMPSKIKGPSKFQKNCKKECDILVEIREPPETVEQFEKLSWPEKAEVKRKFPAAYWSYLAEIREREALERDYDE